MNLSKLLNISPAVVWRYLSNPSMIPVSLSAPKPVSSFDAILALFPNTTGLETANLTRSFLRNSEFFERLNEKLVEKRLYRTNCGGWKTFLYLAVRLLRAQIVVETGVFDGESSAVILQAIRDNGSGLLVSIDLPATETIHGSTEYIGGSLPLGCQPGWAIPDYLRDKHKLVLGDSRELLPRIVKEHPAIDIFLHDSLHTFEHQYFEYSTVWTHLTDGGLLLSDDIFWSAAFHTFCRKKRRKYITTDGFGAVRK